MLKLKEHPHKNTMSTWMESRIDKECKYLEQSLIVCKIEERSWEVEHNPNKDSIYFLKGRLSNENQSRERLLFN